MIYPVKEQQCILVDEFDNEIGVEEKMSTHLSGKLHRAFSAFVFNDKNELILHQRALDKYHSAGLWTNTCCSHPQPGESVTQAGERRLMEEMGFTTSLKTIFSFIYNANLENNLTEHELDHVLVGRFDGEIPFNTDEVMAIRFISLNQLKNEIETNPSQFTAWLKIIISNHFEELRSAL